MTDLQRGISGKETLQWKISHIPEDRLNNSEHDEGYKLKIE